MILEFFDSPLIHDCRFAVVDAAVLECLPKDFIFTRLVPKGLVRSTHLLPGLVDLQSLPDNRKRALCTCLQDTYDELRPAFVAIFFAASSSAHQFARHWNRIQSGAFSQKQKSWFRAHDPRVLHQLLRILSPMQRRGLFGSAYAMHYWIGNKWVTALRETEDAPVGHAPSIGPAGWDWRRIEHISIINRALHRAGLRSLSELTIQGAVAEQLLEQAIVNYGFENSADLVEYTARGLLFGPSFDKNPAISAALQQVANITGSMCLSDRFARIDESVWDALRQQDNDSL